MTQKILVFGASSSNQSINKKLAVYAAHLTTDTELKIINLIDFELPLYSIDLETEKGIPSLTHDFSKLIQESDGIIISLAEHNGLPSVVFKNLSDWLSRIDQNVWKGKPMLLMATSPGARGGSSVLGTMKTLLPYAGANIIADFSLPSFYDNFSGEAITDSQFQNVLKEKIVLLQESILSKEES